MKQERLWQSFFLLKGQYCCIKSEFMQSFLQVRSLTLDVKVWDSSVLGMFQSLGNLFANSVWEELLQSPSDSQAGDAPVG